MSLPSYGLFTPFRDEATNLRRVARSVFNQSARPNLWLLVDDGSTDDSLGIAKELSKEVDWIQIEVRRRDAPSAFAMADVFNFGLRMLARKMQALVQSVFLLAKLDADVILHPRCMESLLREMAARRRIGVMSPSLGFVTETHNSLSYRRPLPFYVVDEPSDGMRIYDKECLTECGWVPRSLAPDTDFLTLARSRDWKTMRLPDILAWKLRRTGHSVSAAVQGGRLAASGYSPVLAFTTLAYQAFAERQLRVVSAFIQYAEEARKRTKDGSYKATRTLLGQMRKLTI